MSEQVSKSTNRKGGKRDGLFQRNGWWWLDYYDAEGKRHRQKAAPDYDTAKKLYREKMTSIAKGEFLNVKEEGISLKWFAEDKYLPTIKGSLSFLRPSGRDEEWMSGEVQAMLTAWRQVLSKARIFESRLQGMVLTGTGTFAAFIFCFHDYFAVHGCSYLSQ